MRDKRKKKRLRRKHRQNPVISKKKWENSQLKHHTQVEHRGYRERNYGKQNTRNEPLKNEIQQIRGGGGGVFVNDPKKKNSTGLHS